MAQREMAGAWADEHSAEEALPLCMIVLLSIDDNFSHISYLEEVKLFRQAEVGAEVISYRVVEVAEKLFFHWEEPRMEETAMINPLNDRYKFILSKIFYK
jgi:hypothetical protein